MPSAGQYIAFYRAYGLEYDKKYDQDWRSFVQPEYDDKNDKWLYDGDTAGEKILSDLRKAGDTTVNINNYSFWTCSHRASSSKTKRVIHTFYLSGGTGFMVTFGGDSEHRIRPFLAF